MIFPFPIIAKKVEEYTLFQTQIDPGIPWPVNCIKLLNRDDEIRMASLRDDQLRMIFLLDRCFRKSLIADHVGCDPTNLSFGINQAGKPFLIDFPDIHFNVSRSGYHFILAIGGKPVGVDIEILSGNPPAPNVLEYLNRYRKTGQDPLPKYWPESDFINWWSMNEAVQKLLGITMEEFGWACPIDLRKKNQYEKEKGIRLIELSLKNAIGWMAIKSN